MGRPASITTDLNVPGQLICWFDDLGDGDGNKEFRFLSNFNIGEKFTIPDFNWPDTDEPIEWDNGEAPFQWLKFITTDEEHAARIAKSAGPSEAKMLGRSRRNPLRPDWEVVKLDGMKAVLDNKYTLEREEGHLLLGTGTALLIEGTHWDDDVWGVQLNRQRIINAQNAPGRNWLGTLTMARRAELLAESLYGMTTTAGQYAASFAINGV